MIRGARSSGSAATRGRKQKSFWDFPLWEQCYGNFCYGDDVILVFSISEDGSTLTLNGAHTSDSGKYTCVATNPAGEEDRIFNLNVYGKFIGFYFLYFYCILTSIIFLSAEPVYRFLGGSFTLLPFQCLL